jgi:hypothetical protein
MAAVPVTEEPRHIVRHRSERFLIYTNWLMPGEWTLFHEHRNDLLAVIAGDTVSVNQLPGSPPTERPVPAGTVVLFPYADSPTPQVHRVSVAGHQPFINVGLEFLESPPAAGRRAGVSPYAADVAQLIADTRRGRAYKAKLIPGQALPLPQQGSAQLLVALDAARLTFEASGNDGTRQEWPATQGDFHFFETNWPSRIINSSDHAATVIVFQAY